MKKSLLNSRSFAITLLIVNLFLFSTAASYAAVKTWVGGAGVALNWTTAANWSPINAPVAGDDIVFNTAGTLTFTTGPAASIAFNSFTVSQGTITLTASGGRTLTIGGAAGTDLSIASGASLVLGSNINIILAASAAADITGSLTLTGSGAFNASSSTSMVNYNEAGAQTVLGITYGNLTISGSGTKTLGGTTTVSGLLNMSSGTINMADLTLTVGSLTGSGDITNTTGGITARTITIGSDNSSPAAYTGVISNGTNTGGVSVTKTGSGTLTLNGTNSYTGKTIISNGILSINTLLNVSGGNSSLGSPTTIANGTIDIASTGTLLYTGAATSSNRVINTTGDGSKIDASGSGTLTLTGGVTATGNNNLVLAGSGDAIESGAMGGGSGTLTKSGTGTWTLGGANTYTGSTTISAGILKLGVSSAIATSGPLGTTASGTFISAGAVLDLNGFSLTAAATEPLTLNGTGITNSGALINSSATASTYIGLLTLGSASSINVNAGDISFTNAGTISGNTFTLSLGGTGTGSITSIIGNTSGGVTKNDAGTWTLSGVSTYSGATTVNEGTLKAGVANQAFGNGSNITLANTTGVLLDITGFNNTIGSLAGGGINGGNVTLGAATLTLGNTTNTSYNGIISGTGGITKAGTGIWTPTGANTYTGKTTISAGTINVTAIDNVGALSSFLGAPATVANGTIDIGGTGILKYTGPGNSSDRVINVTADGGTIDASGAGTLTLTAGITAASFNTVFTGSGEGIESGVIATGAATVTKNGSGTWTLSGANTYSQTTNISSGTLKLGASSAVSTSGPLGTIGGGTIVSAGAVLDLNGFSFTSLATEALTLNGTGISNGGALINSSVTAVSFNGLLAKGTACSIIANAGDINITNGGSISGSFLLTIGGIGNGNITSVISGTNGVTKIGAGTWTLSGSSSYSGTTTVSEGVLKAGVIMQAFGNNSNVVLDNTSGVILDLNGFNNTIGSLSGGGFNGGNVSLGAANLTTGNTTSTAYAGIISGTGSVIKAGSGIWTVSGFNSYTGKTTINGGTLSINTIDILGGGNSSIGNPSTIANGTIDISGSGTGVLLYTGSGSFTDRVINLTSDGGAINASGSGGLTLSGGITGATFNLILTGTGGGLVSSIISTTNGTLSKNGTGTWTLSGANTYTGTTTISAGTLKLGASSSIATSGPLGTTAGGTVVSATGATLDMAGFSLIAAATEPLTLNGTGISNGGALSNSSGGGSTYSGLVTKGSATSIVADAGDINITNPASITGNFLLTLGGSGNGNISSIINSTGGITKIGAGNWNLGSAAVSVSTLTISTGTLVSTSATMNVTGAFTNNSTFTHNGGTVNFNGGAIQTIGGSSVTTFNNIIINNTAGVSLANDEIVNAVLTLTNGNLTIPTGNNLTIANGNPISGTGFGAAKHITTLVNTGTGAKGFLRVDNMAASAAYLFPVGSATNYLPVTLTPSDVTVANNSFNVCSFPGITVDGEPNGTAFTTAQKNNCVDAVWTVNYNGAGTPTAAATNMTVAWPASLEGVNFTGYSNPTIGIAHWDNPNWGTVVGTGDNTANTATRLGVTTFSPFGVGRIDPAGGVLAIKITYFNAAKGNGFNTLYWQANCSSSQAIFELLRSTDGINFTAINSLTASQARCAQPFNYTDNNAPSGNVYYRLRAIDVDGKASYSAIVKLSSQVKDIQLEGIAPNPVVNYAQLKINTNKKDVVDIAVISVDGKIVYRSSVQLQVGTSVVNVDIANLPAGMYMIKGVFSDGQTNTLKFTKK